MVSFYFAGRYDLRDELRQVANRVIANGHKITSSWLRKTRTERLLTHEAARDVAAVDLADIDRAQIVVLFTDLDHHARGGKDTELGYAMDRRKKLIIVGPCVNVFHHLDGIVRFADVADFVDWTRRQGLETKPLIDKREEDEAQSLAQANEADRRDEMFGAGEYVRTLWNNYYIALGAGLRGIAEQKLYAAENREARYRRICNRVDDILAQNIANKKAGRQLEIEV